ncbi:transmembrane protein 234 isoform X5 [Chiloscyllium punctatum]|uniref:transmembrane protein 234 n=1 Tax=Chiloscyllium plagiosum TaxID=36176 RepID=UPI001CB87726|nr:transmembrane protein 234 [Chiloscyllium plagiosum]XP_060703303.1 transmembrane protein 234 [Hemiscyllium ocellatum]
MATVVEVCCLFLVALLWGGTNPFLKKGTEGIEKVKSRNIVIQLFAEVKFLFLNYKYLVPFLLNQSGSVIYYFTLASTDLSLAVLLSNSLTFLFTLLTGKLLGEEIGGKLALIGMLLIIVGVTLCVASTVNKES